MIFIYLLIAVTVCWNKKFKHLSIFYFAQRRLSCGRSLAHYGLWWHRLLPVLYAWLGVWTSTTQTWQCGTPHRNPPLGRSQSMFSRHPNYRWRPRRLKCHKPGEVTEDPLESFRNSGIACRVSYLCSILFFKSIWGETLNNNLRKSIVCFILIILQVNITRFVSHLYLNEKAECNKKGMSNKNTHEGSIV